jgi:hypothetical protein
MTTPAPAFTTIDFSRVTREGHGRHATHDFSKAERPIQAGDWLSWRYRGTEFRELEASYYWVVSEEAGALVLRTPWGAQPVHLSHELAEGMSFADPSTRLPLAHYHEEAQWFAAFRWAVIMCDDDESPAVYMSLQRFGPGRNSITGETVPAELVVDPARLRPWLLNELYQLAHPGLYEQRPADAKQLTEAEAARFTKEVLRRVAKMGVS